MTAKRLEEARQAVQNLHWAITTLRREGTVEAEQCIAEHVASLKVWEAKVRRLEGGSR